MRRTSSEQWIFLLILVGFHIAAPLAQVPEDGRWLDVDVVYLNKKMREVQAQGLVLAWSLSQDEATMSVEVVGNVWDFMPPDKRAEFARRLLSLFSFYIQNRNERDWQFAVLLKKDDATVAEDRGPWMRENKPPRLY